ncbi:MAG TPA: hypothetical protein VGQ99_00690 [Tepidisphaeraceae bacterium]|jgi:hypothetical protein|nr:hypothetical protein [Tepidisphaeraceae bacterium]
MRFFIVVGLVVGLPLMALAQVGPAGPGMEAPTKLEALELRKGTVIVKGYTEIGKVDGEEGSSISVSAIEMKDTARGTREMGLAIVSQQGGEGRRQAISYVDFDEIAGLIAGMDVLAKADPEATRLSAYEAQYRTRSNLEVVSFDSNNQRMISVRAVQVIFPSGEVIWATAHFRLATLAAIRKQISDGKELLDKVKAGGENK